MKKAEFIALVAEKGGMTKKDAGAAVEAVFEALEDALVAGEKLTLPGFGTFEVCERAARKGRSLATNAPVEIPASKAPVFRPNPQLKSKVNG